MLKGALVIGVLAALAAAVLGRGRWHELSGLLPGRGEEDPTIAQVPEPRMPVTAQSTVAPAPPPA